MTHIWLKKSVLLINRFRHCVHCSFSVQLRAAKTRPFRSSFFYRQIKIPLLFTVVQFSTLRVVELWLKNLVCRLETHLHVLYLFLLSAVLFHLILLKFSPCFDIGVIITLEGRNKPCINLLWIYLILLGDISVMRYMYTQNLTF